MRLILHYDRKVAVAIRQMATQNKSDRTPTVTVLL